MKNKDIILVNATSLASGGALTILNQYIDELYNKLEDDKVYYIFVPDSCSIKNNKKNITFIKNSDNPYYLSRNHWNAIGLRKWCNANRVEPYELYSMQNYYPFGFTKKQTIKSLYLHQSIPFYNYNWSIFKREERTLWFYKYIYSLLIRKSIKESDKVIVQTEWFKGEIIKKCNIDENKVVVKRPDLNIIDPLLYNKIVGLKGKVKLFYPANGVVYKNHNVLFKAMNIIVNEYKENDIVLYLTLNEKDNTAKKLIDKFNIGDNIVFTGNLTYEQVMQYYKTVDALVFPSKLETFGLPLIEAQYFNLPIIVSNSDLFKEVIGVNSEKVIFCNCDDERSWVNAIMELIINYQITIKNSMKNGNIFMLN